MKNLKWLLVFGSLLFFSAQGFSWVGDVVYIRGQISSFDKSAVNIIDMNKNVIVLPRTAFPKDYVFHTTDIKIATAIPVLAEQLKHSQIVGGKIKWAKPKVTAEQVERRLAEFKNYGR